MTGIRLHLASALRLGAALSMTVVTLAVPSMAIGQSQARVGSIYAVALIDVLPQKKAQGDAIIRDYVEKVKADRRVISVTFLEERSTPNHYQIVEVLPDQRGYEDHVAQPYVVEFRNKLHGVLGSPYDERLFSDAER